MSIESQATFLLRSVCDYDPNILGNIPVTETVAAGFREFSALLRKIYADWRSYEVSTVPSEWTKIGIKADDLENFHNLSYTVWCLRAIAETGELRCKDGETYFRVTKKDLKAAYRKPTPVPFIFSMLEKYGFTFGYYKGEKDTSDYARCDSFDIHYAKCSELIEALKCITDRLSEPERQRGYSKEATDIQSKMGGDVIFLTADYHLILTAKINTNPLDETILRTLGKYGGLWSKIVALMTDEYGFTAESVRVSCCPYVFPEKSVYFMQKNKVVFKFEVRADCLSMWFPDSYEALKDTICSAAEIPADSITPVSGYTCPAPCAKCHGGEPCGNAKKVSSVKVS
jgi:hypothetical protein